MQGGSVDSETAVAGVQNVAIGIVQGGSVDTKIAIAGNGATVAVVKQPRDPDMSIGPVAVPEGAGAVGEVPRVQDHGTVQLHQAGIVIEQTRRDARAGGNPDFTPAIA